MIKLSKTNRLSAGDKCDDSTLLSEQKSVLASSETEPLESGKVIPFKQADQTGVYAENAMRFFELGYSPMPLREKQPIRKHWSKWREGPHRETVLAHIAAHPNANIGLHCKSSGPNGIVCLDADIPELIPKMLQIAGETPTRIATNRGGHLYYQPAPDLEPVYFRKYGIEIDLKGPRANDYVVAENSIHPTTGLIYSLECGCERVRPEELPVLTNEHTMAIIESIYGSIDKAETVAKGNAKQLVANIRRTGKAKGKRTSKQNQNARRGKRSALEGPVYEGERNNTLNDRLFSIANYTPFEELHFVAQQINLECCIPLLSDKEVAQITDKVISDKSLSLGKSNYFSQITEHDFVLFGGDSRGFHLYARLKGLHRRGDTAAVFPLDRRAMADAEKPLIPGWTEYHYRTGIDQMKNAGVITLVGFGEYTTGRSKRLPKLYTFSPLVMGSDWSKEI